MTSRNSSADLGAQEARRREELGEALVAVAVRMLQNGADAKFVQDWVDGELERMRRVGRPP
jgi:hypothetical protein